MLSAYRVKLRSTMHLRHLLISNSFGRVIFEALEKALKFPSKDDINRGNSDVVLLFAQNVQSCII